MRTADDELARGVHVVGDLVVEQGLHALGQLFFHTGDQDLDHVLLDLCEHLGLRGEIIVLGADHDGIDALGRMVVVVLDGHLALGVRAQVGHLGVLLAADGGEFLQQAVAEVQGQGHVGVRIAAGVAEHHALVAGALVLGLLALHALVDIRALLMDGAEHAAAVRLEHVLAFGVPDAADHVTCDLLHVEVGFALHLTGQHHLPGGDQGFAGHLAVGIEGQEMVDERVADLVGHLVGVAFADAFGGEEVGHELAFNCSLSGIGPQRNVFARHERHRAEPRAGLWALTRPAGATSVIFLPRIHTDEPALRRLPCGHIFKGPRGPFSANAGMCPHGTLRQAGTDQDLSVCLDLDSVIRIPPVYAGRVYLWFRSLNAFAVTRRNKTRSI